MSPRATGPQRSESVESYLRQTRVGAAVALLALAAAIVSEQFAEHLWERHPLLAGLASSAIVVLLSVAVVNEALEVRRQAALDGARPVRDARAGPGRADVSGRGCSSSSELMLADGEPTAETMEAAAGGRARHGDA